MTAFPYSLNHHSSPSLDSPPYILVSLVSESPKTDPALEMKLTGDEGKDHLPQNADNTSPDAAVHRVIES